MPTSSRHTSKKPSNFNYLLSKIFPFDRRKGGEIADNWEIVDFCDSENACEEDGPTTQGEDPEIDYGEPNFSNISSNKRYTYLTKADVLQLLEDMITDVSAVLWLERKTAALLLQRFKWDVNQTCDEWLEHEEKVCKEVGLYMKPVAETPPANAAEITCSICHTDFPRDAMLSVSCGHQICRSCWEGYIREAINIGPQCLTLRCPEPSCDAAVDFNLIKLLSSEDDKEKFENHLLRSYLGCSSEGRWCPAPGCNYAVFSSNGEEDSVTCQCLHSFCWNCSGEAHAPVDCNTLAQWMSELASQSESWLSANIITCPNCAVKFDKGSNTSYDECPTCGHKYCRVCGEDRGDAYYWTHSCEPDNEQKMLYGIFLKYNHCYTEWATCEASRANALTEYRIKMELQLELLCVMFGVSSKELDFLSEALLQVAKYWQFLKWTHVYGYYLPASEGGKKQFLEFLQADAARQLRRTQKQIEELLQDSLDCPAAEFWLFRSKILGLTHVTRTYFDRLMEGIKAGLSEVENSPNPSLKHKMSRDDEEKGCSGRSSTQLLDSPSLSPTAKIMKLFDDMDVRGPVSNFNPAEFCFDFSPSELEAKPKVAKPKAD